MPPALDLTREAALQRLLIDGITGGLIRSAHDCANGGLAVTLAECCFDSGSGVEADVPAVAAQVAAFVDITTLFGESASRAVVSVSPERLEMLMSLAAAGGVPARRIGTVGGDRIKIAIAGRTVVDELLTDATDRWSNAIDSRFERARALA